MWWVWHVFDTLQITSPKINLKKSSCATRALRDVRNKLLNRPILTNFALSLAFPVMCEWWAWGGWMKAFWLAVVSMKECEVGDRKWCDYGKCLCSKESIPFLIASTSLLSCPILSLKNFSLWSVNSFSILSMSPASCLLLLPSLSSLPLLTPPFTFLSFEFSLCSGPLSDRNLVLLSLGFLVCSISLLSLLPPEVVVFFLACFVFNLLLLRVSSPRWASSPLESASASSKYASQREVMKWN